ncbi:MULTISPECIES: hypothetical protein [unclassified Bradyrhizobium]|uniref:hypothetical protein n=1 Tax=unclassified Bradyrhizobium TaxID=2631580 RepID=UPI001FFA388D|nr:MULTISPECIES: hypothetical protein [unclassified Bradyrhizobium]MCK1536069.1 hypothetical protein [Bradyrhizobium sp. 176]MCK1557255.1 hypothetical protein [Bradyrhizobium sp. 171]
MSFNQTVQHFIHFTFDCSFFPDFRCGLFDCFRRLAAAEFGFCVDCDSAAQVAGDRANNQANQRHQAPFYEDKETANPQRPHLIWQPLKFVQSESDHPRLARE